MLIQEHMKQLVTWAAPHLAHHTHDRERLTVEQRRDLAQDCPDCKLWFDLLNQIKPIKYGNTVFWAAATQYTLAQYQIPHDAAYHVVMRVECYTVNLTNAAADYGMREPVPPGKAFWEFIPYGTGTTYPLTDVNAQSHIICDADDYKIFKEGYTLALIGNFLAPSDGASRNVCTTVYGYDVGPQIIERIGGLTVVEPPTSGN